MHTGEQTHNLKAASVLLVEDDLSLGKSFLELFEQESNLEFVWAKTYDEAKKALSEREFDIAIADLRLSEGREFEGIQLVQELNALLSPPIVIVSTGYKGDAESDPDFPNDFIFALYEKGVEPLSKLYGHVEKARQLKRVQRLLGSAGKYASGRTFITEELKKMLEQFVKLTEAYVCHLLLPAEDKAHLEIVVDTGNDEGRPIPIDDSVTGEAYLTQRTINLGDTSRHPRYKKVAGDKRMNSELVVPLMEDSRAIGVLNIESEHADAFTEEHMELMLTFARFVVATLQNDRRRQDLQDLVGTTTSQLLESVVDLEKVFDTILDRGLKLINANSGLLALVEGKQLRVAATLKEETWTKDSILEIGSSICGLAVDRGYAINVRDIRQERYAQYYIPAIGINRLSQLAVPLRLEGHVIGVLNFASPEPSAFTSEDQRLLVALANQAAVAIRVAEDLKQLRKNERSATILDLAGGLTHNVNSPANGILYDLAQIQMNCADALQVAPMLGEYLGRIERAAKKILDVPRLITEKTAQYKERVLMTAEMLVIPKLQTMEERREIPTGISIVTDILPGMLRFMADEDLTPVVIENLIVNAKEAMKDKGTIRIGSRRSPDRSMVEVWVEDSGSGIPSHLREIIFDRGFSTKGQSGIGLWWVRTHLERLNATVHVEDAVIGGARFVIRLPVHDAIPVSEGRMTG